MSRGCDPGMRRNTSRIACTAPNAFWWQWPWSRMGALAGCRARLNRPARASRARNSSSSQRVRGDELGRLAEMHDQPFVAQCQQARGLQSDDGHAPLRERRERVLELRRLAPGALDHADAQIAAPATIGTAAFLERVHEIAGRMQHARRRGQVLRLERSVEGIDEKYHGLAACGPCLEHLIAARPRDLAARAPEGIRSPARQRACGG